MPHVKVQEWHLLNPTDLPQILIHSHFHSTTMTPSEESNTVSTFSWLTSTTTTLRPTPRQTTTSPTASQLTSTPNSLTNKTTSSLSLNELGCPVCCPLYSFLDAYKHILLSFEENQYEYYHINYEEFGGNHCLLVCDHSRTGFVIPFCHTARQIQLTKMFWLIKYDKSIV